MGGKLKLLALFAIGVGLLFPFEYTITLILGVGFLLAFVVYGTFLIAEPAFLSSDFEGDKPNPEIGTDSADDGAH